MTGSAHPIPRTCTDARSNMSDPMRAFLDQSGHYLESEYLPKIRESVRRLGPDDLWWRPNPASNSVGNLLLHLSGNLRQWIVSGVGQRPDVRQRQAEFEANGGHAAEELLDRLAATVREAAATLAALDPARLQEPRRIQGKDVSVLEAVYHAVEHFSTHTGQIAYIAKMRAAVDLGFYEIVDGVAHERWRDA